MWLIGRLRFGRLTIALLAFLPCLSVAILAASQDSQGPSNDPAGSPIRVRKAPIHVAPCRTALLDAIYLGLDAMKHATTNRKALLIISDGGDNHSRYTENDIKRAVKEADVEMYVGSSSPWVLVVARWKKPSVRSCSLNLPKCPVVARSASRTRTNCRISWRKFL
jgi:hypothetical protein